MPRRRPIRRDLATTSPHEGATVCSAGAEEASFPVLSFSSCFAYLPAGSGAVCEEGRLLCANLKAADPLWLPRLVARVWLEASGHGRFTAAFGGRVVLVPVPGSSAGPHVVWVGERLAWYLKEIGLAAEVWPVLQRRHAVRKSAFAPAGERPSVLEHYRSFAIDRASLPAVASGRRDPGVQLVLVDDVITRGRTLLAAAGRLHEAFPAAQVRAFALLRTLAWDETPRRILDPCDGEVRWVAGDARRWP